MLFRSERNPAASLVFIMPLFLVVGMINTKDAAGFLSPLAPYTEMLVAVTIPGEKNALPADAIAAAAHSVGIAARAVSSIGEAMRHLAGHRSGRVLICGSLYFAGRALAENDEQEGTR